MKPFFLLTDFGGPLLSDLKVEQARKQTVYSAAKKSGIWEKMCESDSRLRKITNQDIVARYEDGKKWLKQNAQGAEAYNDINRLAATAGILLQDNEVNLTGNITKEVTDHFWASFCPTVQTAAIQSMQVDSLNAIKKIIIKYRVPFHVIMDNWPQLYFGVFEPVIVHYFGSVGLPKLEYRKPGTKRKTTNCVYVSGEGWGNKKFSSTWKRIIDDIGAQPADTIFYIDDSPKKLRGFQEFCVENNFTKTILIRFNAANEPKSEFKEIEAMAELQRLIENVIRND